MWDLTTIVSSFFLTHCDSLDLYTLCHRQLIFNVFQGGGGNFALLVAKRKYAPTSKLMCLIQIVICIRHCDPYKDISPQDAMALFFISTFLLVFFKYLLNTLSQFPMCLEILLRVENRLPSPAVFQMFWTSTPRILSHAKPLGN